MFQIVEQEFTNGSRYFERFLVDTNGEKTLLGMINISGVNIVVNNRSYMYLYTSKREIISDVFVFLNFYIRNKSDNTKILYLNALKMFFSFVEMFSIDYRNIKTIEIKRLKDFLYGKSIVGENISFIALSKRGPDTINNYLSVYRAFYDYLGIKNSPFHSKIINMVKGDKGLKGHAQKRETFSYKENEKSQRNKRKVPMYISIDEFNKILLHIRKSYSIREEIIIRLMFECGMRIGEVLGLTLEDIETSPFDIEYKEAYDLGSIIIQNRTSDQRYQLAKSCYNPRSADEYHTSIYDENGAGFQRVYPTIALLRLIEQYIEEAHGVMSTRNRQNYLKFAKADKVSKGDNLSSNDNYYLFLNKNGSNLSSSGWNKIIRQIFLDCGLRIDNSKKKHNLNHRFRHGYAMFLKKHLKLTDLDIMFSLRHSSPDTVKIYTKPDDNDIYKANKEATESMYTLVPALQY